MAKKRTTGVLAYSSWDAVPVTLAFVHLAYLVSFFLLFHYHLLPWYAVVALGLIYSVSISWNINGISHNFIHNPYFRSTFLNRLFSVLESASMLFSQQFYDSVHRRHHMGNADLPDEQGHTIDPLSIYQHGHDGMPEGMIAYTFLTFFRDDIKSTYRDIVRLSKITGQWAIAEMVCTGVMFLAGFAVDWRFMLVFIPFWYFGHSLSNLNGYYEHYRGKPAVPIAWGVSSYNRLYNAIWFNNGYHAEHHYRPRVHWTQMKSLHEQIKDEQQRAGVHVIAPPHALGFLQPSDPAPAENASREGSREKIESNAA